MLEKIMSTQKVSPSEAIFVGDAESDVKMAKNARVKPIVVLTGHLSKSQAKELNVEYIIEDVTKLEEVLVELKSSLKFLRFSLRQNQV